MKNIVKILNKKKRKLKIMKMKSINYVSLLKKANNKDKN
jgi:hypothetical protein